MTENDREAASSFDTSRSRKSSCGDDTKTLQLRCLVCSVLVSDDGELARHTESHFAETRDVNADALDARKCGKCGLMVAESSWQSHTDEHFALDLWEKDNLRQSKRAFADLVQSSLGEYALESEAPAKIIKLMDAKPDTETCTTPHILSALKIALQHARSQTRRAWLCARPVLHIRSSHEAGDVGWGCGYRNIQMLMSHRESRVEQLPSFSDIQHGISAGWARGIDSQGAQDYGDGLTGTRKWIGTTEAYTYFLQSGIESRIYTVETDSRGRAAERLLRFLLTYFSGSSQDCEGVQQCAVEPLYMQVQGHSYLIVGLCERAAGGQEEACASDDISGRPGAKSTQDLQVVVFDPNRKPTAAIQEIAASGLVAKPNALRAILAPYLLSSSALSNTDQFEILQCLRALPDAQVPERLHDPATTAIRIQ